MIQVIHITTARTLGITCSFAGTEVPTRQRVAAEAGTEAGNHGGHGVC